MAVMVADDVPYLVSGSKNTCQIWPADKNFDECLMENFPDDDAHLQENAMPHIAIGRAYSRWFHSLDKLQQTEFADALWRRYGGHCTLVGEVNRPWEEHVIAITGKQVGQTIPRQLSRFSLLTRLYFVSACASQS